LSLSRRTTEGIDIANTLELKNRVQAEIDNHMKMAKALQEKLSLIMQVENLANELGVKADPQLPKVIELEAKPEPAKEEPPKQAPPEIAQLTVEQSAPVADSLSKDTANNGSKNPYASMQQGLQAYMGGKTDKALEFFKEARDLNPAGFEKTWTTMTSIPVYQVVGRDKYIIEVLFQK
jgi:hypothetical protein